MGLPFGFISIFDHLVGTYGLATCQEIAVICFLSALDFIGTMQSLGHATILGESFKSMGNFFFLSLWFSW